MFFEFVKSSGVLYISTGLNAHASSAAIPPHSSRSKKMSLAERFGGGGAAVPVMAMPYFFLAGGEAGAADAGAALSTPAAALSVWIAASFGCAVLIASASCEL